MPLASLRGLLRLVNSLRSTRRPDPSLFGASAPMSLNSSPCDPLLPFRDNDRTEGCRIESAPGSVIPIVLIVPILFVDECTKDSSLGPTAVAPGIVLSADTVQRILLLTGCWLACLACSAAKRPAPPVPRMRISVFDRSICITGPRSQK